MKTRLEQFMKQGLEAQKAVDALTKPTPTPTPWKTSYTLQNAKDPLFWHSAIIRGGLRVAVAAGTSHDEAEANAAFIVRAVNSHQALVEAVKCADGIQRAIDENAKRSHEAECVYCYALAQAEGK